MQHTVFGEALNREEAIMELENYVKREEEKIRIAQEANDLQAQINHSYYVFVLQSAIFLLKGE